MADREPGDIVVTMDASVAALIEERHILEQDIKQVIYAAESTEEKLYQPGANRFLAKLKGANATFYVEYSPSDDGYQVHTAYFHRSEIIEG